MSDIRLLPRGDAAGELGSPLAAPLGPLWEELRPGKGDRVKWAVLPSESRPRLLAPLEPRTPLGAALGDYMRSSSPTARAVGLPLARLMRAGVPVALGRSRVVELDAAAADALAGHLSEAVGEVVVPAVHLGNERANRKPILYLLSPKGELVAVAKVATSPFVRGLLECEEGALHRLESDPLPGVLVPRPLRAGPWRGIELYAQSALPLRSSEPVGARYMALSVAAELGRRHAHQCRLTSTPWWAELRRRADSAPRHSDRALLGRLAEQGESLHGDADVGFGMLHGDFSPWNVARRGDSVLLWDWERFEAAGPAGLDGLHYALYLARVSSRGPEAAVGELLADAPRVLGECGVTPGALGPVLLAYAFWVACRYLVEQAPQRVRLLAETLAGRVLATHRPCGQPARE